MNKKKKRNLNKIIKSTERNASRTKINKEI